ncbi:hypothetical protein EBX93_11210 [bacterium]|nr:hypothetical protein [bacterium]
MQIQAFLIDSTEYGGNARQLLASVTQLRAMDYKVAVGVLGKKTPWSKLLSDTGAMVTHFESKGLWDIRALFRLREWIKNTKELLDDKIAIVNSKYGSENWYGATGVSEKNQKKSNYSANNLPPGVTKELWNVMTDEEKAAF